MAKPNRKADAFKGIHLDQDNIFDVFWLGDGWYWGLVPNIIEGPYLKSYYAWKAAHDFVLYGKVGRDA